jgi:predicted RNA-binding Zn-ribbon protein involved in translation (DUF1610 family)
MKTNCYQIKTVFLAIVVSGYFMFLAGCATPYQPCGLTGGYSETQLDENVFQVSFHGNGFTSQERASDLCLLRAAEIAKQHGFAYFIIVEKYNRVEQSAYTTPTTTTTNVNIATQGTAHVHGNNINYNSNSSGTATSYTTGGQTYIISKPKTTNVIICFKEKPKVDGLVYNVDFILKSLPVSYGLKIGATYADGKGIPDSNLSPEKGKILSEDVKKQQQDTEKKNSQEQSNTPITKSPTIIKCENCGHEIGRLEKAYVHDGHIVCSQCFLKLKQQP